MLDKSNPAAAAYLRMDIENLPEDKPEEKNTGLLRKPSSAKSSGLDLNNPAVRVGKQMQVIRKYKNEINEKKRLEEEVKAQLERQSQNVTPSPYGELNKDDPTSYRSDGSMKGWGFFGPIANEVNGGGPSTEITVGVEIDGKEMEIPSMSESLTKDQLDRLLSLDLKKDIVPMDIVRTAQKDAVRRLKAGLPVFATKEEEGKTPRPQHPNNLNR
jgi:hypothetical protein